jgi:hypothetical protein
MNEPPIEPYAPPREVPATPRLADRPENPRRMGSWLLLAQSVVGVLVWLIAPERVWIALLLGLLLVGLAVALLRVHDTRLSLAALLLLVVQGMGAYIMPDSEHATAVRAVGAAVTLLNVAPFALLLLARPTRAWRNAAAGLLLVLIVAMFAGAATTLASGGREPGPSGTVVAP